jgi:hypothetical protein
MTPAKPAFGGLVSQSNLLTTGVPARAADVAR